jgi:energy-coupling factor transport system permease protein
LLGALFTIAQIKRQPTGTYIKLGAFVSVMPMFVNFFLVHSGDTILYTIPYSFTVLGQKIPALFFAGPITLESVAMGLIMAVFITNMLFAFQLFNNLTSADAILRLFPPQLASVGLACSITLRFIPTILSDHRSISDAQKSRGVTLASGPIPERLKNQLYILSPTVVTSLERGFNLAESMAARGYGKKRSTYRRQTWTKKEILTSMILAAGIMASAYAKYTGQLEFWPYDGLTLPAAAPTALFPIAAILIPALTDHEKS